MSICLKKISHVMVMLVSLQGCGGGGSDDKPTPVSIVNSSASSASASVGPTTKPSKAGNDDFGKRIIVEGIRPVMVGTLFNATLERNEMVPAGFYNVAASVWYQWSSPTTGQITIQKFAEELGNLGAGDIGFYKGDNLSNLVEVRPEGNPRSGWPLVFAVQTGVTYQIQVFSASTTITSPFRFHLRATQVPNDSFTAPQQLLENVGSLVDLTLLNSNIEVGEPDTKQDDIAPNHSAWFRYDSLTIGKLRVDINGLVGGAFHPLPEVRFYTGDTLNSLIKIQSDFSYVPIYDIQPNKTYYIQLFNRGPIYLASSFDNVAFLFENAFDFDWKLFTAPANDDFINAKNITPASNVFSGSLPYETTLAATREPNEQQHSYNVLADKISRGSIWYKWTSPKTGLFAFKTKYQSNGVGVNSLIGIYQGDTLDTLIKEIPKGIGNTNPAGTLINAVNAADVTKEPLLLANLLVGDGKYGCLELQATEGISYFISIDSIDRQIPDFSFQWNYFERNNASSSSSSLSSSSSSSSIAASGEGCNSSQP